MNNVLLLNSLTQLANAIFIIQDQISPHGADDKVVGHLQMFEKQVAQLRSQMQSNDAPHPQLNKAGVIRSAYIIQYSSIGKDYEVCIEATNLNRALLEFASYYQHIDVVHSVTKAE